MVVVMVMVVIVMVVVVDRPQGGSLKQGTGG